MIGWGSILYGAALSAVAAAVLVAFVLRARRVAVIVTGAAAAALGPLAWNAILHMVDASGFFVDAPIAVFPVSWQDTGSGVFALAAAFLLLTLGPMRAATGAVVARAAIACGLAALVVDVYLY
jgi:hypothetical protein